MKHYLFDFDGTLVDSMPTYVTSMLRILDECNIRYQKDIVKTITPLGLNGTADYYLSLGVPLTKEQILRRMGEYMLDAYHHHIPAKAHVTEVLHKLRERGCGLHVLTASPHITLDACLKRLALYNLFDNVWSCDDFTTTKADPTIYTMAAERIGAPVEEILFLDDNYNADATAKQAGMKVCGVYDASSEEYTAQIKDITDYYIHDFSELLTIGL